MEMLLISHSTGDICPHPQCCAEFPPKLSWVHSQRFSDGIEVSGRLAACWKMS